MLKLISLQVQDLLVATAKQQQLKGGVIDERELNWYTTTMMKVRPLSRRYSEASGSREFYGENDRLVKRLFRAIQDGDINYVSKKNKHCFRKLC